MCRSVTILMITPYLMLYILTLTFKSPIKIFRSYYGQFAKIVVVVAMIVGYITFSVTFFVLKNDLMLL